MTIVSTSTENPFYFNGNGQKLYVTQGTIIAGGVGTYDGYSGNTVFNYGALFGNNGGIYSGSGQIVRITNEIGGSINQIYLNNNGATKITNNGVVNGDVPLNVYNN